jgi:hypothetical protein
VRQPRSDVALRQRFQAACSIKNAEGTPVRCGDETLVVGAKDWVSMPRGVPHTFRVVGDRPARILLVHDNAAFRDLIRDISTPARERVVPSHPTFPPMDGLARIAASHDLRPIGPPMSAEDTLRP